MTKKVTRVNNTAVLRKQASDELKASNLDSLPDLPHSIDWITKSYSIVIAAVVLFILIFSINLFLGWRQLEERKRITLNDDKTTASLLTYIIMERNKATIEILQSYAHRNLFVTSVKNKDIAGVHRHMSDLKKNAEIDLTFVTDKRGSLWVNFPIFPEAIGKDLSSRDWYKGISSNWTPYISTVFKLIVGDKPPAAAFCVPIFDEKEMVVGILATSQRLGFLEDINRHLPLNPNIKVIITDQKGQILYSNKYSYKESITDYRLFPIAEQALKAKKQQVEISDPQEDQGKIYLTVVPVVDSGWSVIIERPSKDIFRLEISNLILRSAISFLLLLLIISFLVYLRKAFLFRKTEELLQAEIKLHQGEEWHRNILKITMDGFWAVDMQGNLLEVNDVYSQMSGYSEQELLSMRISDLQATETVKDTTDHIQKIVAEGEDRFESLHRRKDGSLFNVESSVHYRPSNGGQIVAFLRDITSRKHAEERLYQSEEKFSKAFQTSPYAITITRPEDGTFIEVNDAFTSMTGFTKEEGLAGSSIGLKMWVNEEDRQSVVDALSKGQAVVSREYLFRTKSAQVITGLFSAQTIRLSMGNCILSSISDITDRKQTEELIKAAHERLVTVLNGLDAIVYVADIKTHELLFVNDFVKGVFGDIVGQPCWKTIQAGQTGPCAFCTNDKLFDVVGNSTGIYHWEFQNTANGHWYDVRDRAIQWVDGHIVRMEIATDITERKLAEEKLHKEKNLIANIMETSPVGITTVDASGKITFANSKAVAILGLSKDKVSQATYNAPTWHISDLEGKPFPDDQLPFNIVMSTGKSVFDVQHAIQWPDGKRILLSINGVPMTDTSGKVSGMVASIEDMTQRKLAEEALRETNEYLNNLFNYANAPIITWDHQFRITRFNHAFELITGRKMEQVVGASIEILFPLDQMAKSLELIKKTKAGERWETVEIDILNIDGTIRTLLWNSATIFDEDGKTAIATIAQGQDITERKIVEEKYQTLFREMLDGFALHEIICDEQENPVDYRFIAVNPIFERMTGQKAEKLVGRTVMEVLPGTERHWIETYGNVAITGEPAFFENYSAELGKHFEVTAFRTAPNQFACMFTDITDRKRAIEEKAKLEAQLFQSQKMEAIGTLAGGIAHDFNNILAVIIGYTELARDRSQKENKEQYLQETLKGAERARNLVKQILTFSRQEGNEKKPLDIKVLLKEAVKFLRASIPSTIEIDQHITGEDYTIMADPTQMHQVIMNLCTNASHAMKETGGTLKVELSNIELGKDEIPNHPELQPGHYVKLSVSDTGYGIDPAIIQNIFDPFFTTKSVDEGTGLGLSVVYGIVKGHGGAINVYSKPGKGAAFHVYLPRIIHEETIKGDIDKPVIGGTERILFVDDEPSLVDIGMRMLFPLGYHVTGAKSSKEALDMFRADPHRFDLIITDMTLPQMTGIDLSREMLKIRPDIPIILCSGIKEPKTEAQVKSLGIKAYLTKPLTRREISGVIREVLDGKEKKEKG